MADAHEAESRFHDLFAVFLGAFAAGVLISTPWQVDTTGPDPFYKGPLIFPLLVLSLMALASLPAAWRLIKPPEGASWHLDGKGYPLKTTVVLGFLVAYLFGVRVFGLTFSSWAFLFVSLYYLKHRSPLKLILIPLIITGLVVITFKVFLEVFFPTPLLIDWFSE
ncbi:MAG: tripartite tricarboxylate transporter TctB family protein [Deltaproteobacteria bacterium]|nr:tripartite tricarboxylate transporter TctB family protein [Deltaproteobacteria bacterium]